MGNDIEYIYIIGSTQTEKYIGYTYDKNDAKRYVKSHTGYAYKKIEASNFDFNNRVCDELVHVYGNNLMIASDEDYMFQGFEQYQLDLIYHIEKFMLLLDYVKFSKNELKVLNYLIDFLMEYTLAKKHGTLEGSEEEFFNYDAVVKWFIDNVGG